ncbi:MAG: DUF1289 domain-containing protein [Methylotenera sp.]
MSKQMQEEVESPCIGVCSMNDETGFCHGCYRTIDEIRAWWDMPVEQQKALLQTLEQRQQAAFD